MTNQLEVSNLLTPIITAYKAFSDETKGLLQIGLSDYIQNQTEKYYFTNTFIHRTDKVRFKDIYYPIKAHYKNLTTDFADLESVFEEYKKITIVGSGGSGKTTLIKHIFLKVLEEKKRIPILIELRNLNEFNGDFEKFVLEKVLKSDVKPNQSILVRAFKEGRFFFLFDGYDEIFSTKKNEIIRQIEQFVDTYSKNYFLMTTRPGSGIESFPRFYDFRVCSLENNDVKGFIDKIVEDSERRERIKQIFTSPENSNYMEFLRNPLLLSMFIMAFENHPEIPNKKSSFYRNVFDTLYSRHDGITKNSYTREKSTKLQRDNFEEILSIFSYISLLDGQYTFTYEYITDTLNETKKLLDYDFNTEFLIYDLRTSISILILDGFEFYFPHRSIQEYFTALFVSKLLLVEEKEMAYENLLHVLEKSSNDRSNNFWSLCFELDENMFISNFLIPQLTKIDNRLKNKSGMELLREFDELFDYLIIKLPTINLSTNGTIKKIGLRDNIEFKIVRHISFWTTILDFCEIQGNLAIHSFLENCNRYDELFEAFDNFNDMAIAKRRRHRDNDEHLKVFISNPQTEFSKLLFQEDFFRLLENYKENISKKITELEKKVKKRKNSINDFLKK